MARSEHAVGPCARTLRPPAAGDEGKDLLGLRARHLLLALGSDVGQFAQGNLEGHRHVIEAVDGDRLFAALHLTDELAAEPGALAQPLLAQPPLLAQGPQTLAEEFS